MTTTPCPISERLATEDSGAHDGSLHAHVAGCPSCQDMLLVTAALAAAADDDGPLPDPRLLWLRARSEARARAARRAIRAIDVVQAVAATLLAGALGALAVALGSSFGGALAEALLGLVAAPGLLGLPLLAIAAVVALLVPPLVALVDRV